MTRRRAGAAGPRSGRGLFERFLFGFMGPPQLGDPDEPLPAPPDAAADLCPRCRRPWDEHERVRTSSRGYARCPGTSSA